MSEQNPIEELCDALLDCIWQECSKPDGSIYDMGMSCYEYACDVLVRHGYLARDGRCCYKVTDKGKALGYCNE